MKHDLKRDLGLLDIFCLASGAMISSGIFILPGMAYGQAGPLVFVSYFLAGMLALIGTLSIVELATAMPKAGGDYFFITRSLGPLIGTISAFLSWTALCLKSAFAIFGIVEILYLSLGIPILVSAFVICLIFGVLNILGVKEAAKLETWLVLALFAIMLGVVAGGIGRITEGHFTPIVPNGFNQVLATAGFVFISFGGLLNIASVSGEVKDPVKNIPRGMFLSVVAVTIIYTLILFVTVGVLPGEELAASLTPIADAGRLLFGHGGYLVISFAALLAFVTTANAGMMSASRYPLALSKDRLLPDVISVLTKTKKSPVVAIIITTAAVFGFLLLELTTLVKLGSIVILTLYILTNMAVIILREGHVQNYRPSFCVPLYPWMNIIGIIFFTMLIIDMGLAAVELSFAVVAVAVFIYFFYGRQRHNIEYALLHLIERIVNKDLTTHALEEELKCVIIDRDGLKVDEFHRLVQDAAVLDIDEAMTAEDFFHMLAERTAGDIGLDEQKAVELFYQREGQGTTAISSFVAIPHIIIPGENRFKLVVARARRGIHFTDEADSVKAVFVLFGTKDRATFHLKVLSAIAHIVQNRHFERSWLRVRNQDQLRDILLLSERKRLH